MSAIAKQKGVGVPSGPVSEQLLIPFPFQHNGGKRGEKLTQNATATTQWAQNDLIFRPEKLPKLEFEPISFSNKQLRGSGFKSHLMIFSFLKINLNDFFWFSSGFEPKT